jgi:hypothetical protein
MTKLRDLARGQSCMVRIPGVCNWNTETTVLAHIRRPGNAGVALKPSDLCGVWACSSCHDEIDRRTQAVPSEQIPAYLLDALVRQLDWYERKEVLITVIA